MSGFFMWLTLTLFCITWTVMAVPVGIESELLIKFTQQCESNGGMEKINARNWLPSTVLCKNGAKFEERKTPQ